MFNWHRAVPSHLFTRPCWQVEQYLPMTRVWEYRTLDKLPKKRRLKSPRS